MTYQEKMKIVKKIYNNCSLENINNNYYYTIPNSYYYFIIFQNI